MSVAIFYPANERLSIYISDQKCEFCGASDVLYVDKNKEEIFNPFDDMPRDCYFLNVNILNANCENEKTKKEDFSIDLSDPEVREKGVDIRIEQSEEIKFFIEFEGRFYEFDEFTWSEKANNYFFKDVYATCGYGKDEFLIKIIRQMPTKIESFDDDAMDENDDPLLTFVSSA